VTGGCNNGGGSSSTKCEALASIEIFDLTTHTWRAGPSMLMPRHGHGVGLCPHVGLVVFGGSSELGIMTNPTPTRSTEVLPLKAPDQSASQLAPSWRDAGALNVPRYGVLKGFGLNVNGYIFAVGGSTLDPGKFHPSATVERVSCAALVAAIGIPSNGSAL